RARTAKSTGGIWGAGRRGWRASWAALNGCAEQRQELQRYGCPESEQSDHGIARIRQGLVSAATVRSLTLQNLEPVDAMPHRDYPCGSNAHRASSALGRHHINYRRALRCINSCSRSKRRICSSVSSSYLRPVTDSMRRRASDALV